MRRVTVMVILMARSKAMAVIMVIVMARPLHEATRRDMT